MAFTVYYTGLCKDEKEIVYSIIKHVKYERQLKKGIFEILVLSLLAENDKYGYQLISEMEI